MANRSQSPRCTSRRTRTPASQIGAGCVCQRRIQHLQPFKRILRSKAVGNLNSLFTFPMASTISTTSPLLQFASYSDALQTDAACVLMRPLLARLAAVEEWASPEPSWCHDTLVLYLVEELLQPSGFQAENKIRIRKAAGWILQDLREPRCGQLAESQGNGSSPQGP